MQNIFRSFIINTRLCIIIFSEPIQDQRVDRQIDEEALKDPTNVQKLKYKENVLGKNVSPSLQKKD